MLQYKIRLNFTLFCFTCPFPGYMRLQESVNLTDDLDGVADSVN